MRFWMLVMAVFGFLAIASPARAHPADEASVSHYLWITANPGELQVQHATIVGGLIAAEVWPQLDKDGDKKLSAEEQEAFAESLAKDLTLEIDGKPLPAQLESYEFPSHTEWFGGLSPAIKLLLTARLPKFTQKPSRLVFKDGTFAPYPAVVPLPVVRKTGVAAGEASLSEDGRTATVFLGKAGAILPAVAAQQVLGSGRQRLPGFSLSDPSDPTDRSENLQPTRPPKGPTKLDDVNPNEAPLFPERGTILFNSPPGEHSGHDEAEGLKGLLGKKLSPWLILLGLGAALLAGAAHALTPGHGKTIVAAYLVGTRGTVRDAIVLGIVVTLTHTGSVYLLGALCLWLTSRIRTELVEIWLSTFSGLLVLGMGFWLFQRGLLAYHGLVAPAGHGHSHDHGHGNGPGHSHEASDQSDESHQSGENPSETAHRPLPTAHSKRRPPSDSPIEDAQPPKRPEPGAGKWGVIGLGVAGGIVPCTDALAILLASVNLGSIWLGLTLILAFSLGMALVLVAIGIVMVTAKGFAQRFAGERQPWVRLMPVVSGGLLFLLGAWLTLAALQKAGIVHFGT